jgi:phytoene dehydrogenase-like protein
MRGNPDAVIVGSGPNGLAAAVTLAAAGLAVQVIEGAPAIGGGCRTQELTLPGFRHDICSAVPSIALASPFFQRFDLKARGVRFARPQVEFAHPLDGGRAAIVSASVAETAARLGADGRSYRRLIGPLASHLDELCQVLLAGDRLLARYRAALDRYRYGAGICKVDFALSGPVPWANQDCRRAGTLHLGGPFEEIAMAEAQVAAGVHPLQPYVLVVQPGAADPTWAPAGRATLWAYCHVPARSGVNMAARIEEQIERFAPGF